jgi:hypothetical protein
MTGLAAPHPGPASVLVDELDAGGFERAANSEVIRRCHQGRFLGQFGTPDRRDA